MSSSWRHYQAVGSVCSRPTGIGPFDLRERHAGQSPGNAQGRGVGEILELTRQGSRAGL